MLEHFFKLYIPLVITNVLHMVLVKKDLLSGLKIPVSVKLFGQNKTIRGFVFVTLVNGFFYCLFNQNFGPEAFSIGSLIGFSYVLFELPNSFAKRKLGIAPGQTVNKYRFLVTFMDKADSALGVSLTYCLLNQLTAMTFVGLFGIAFCIHLFFSYILVVIKIKESL